MSHLLEGLLSVCAPAASHVDASADGNGGERECADITDPDDLLGSLGLSPGTSCELGDQLLGLHFQSKVHSS